MRESKKGEYLTLYGLKPEVRNSSIVIVVREGATKLGRYIRSTG